MRVIVQRVSKAHVAIDGNVHNSIDQGMLVLAGFEHGDSQEDIDWMTRKLVQMRIFQDVEAKMNLSIEEISGEILLISQFTLHASVKKGNRPSFIRAAPPAEAEQLYDAFTMALSVSGLTIKTGIFGAYMQITLINDGPVTLFVDSKQKE